MGKMFFNVLATFAGFEGGLIRLRTREGMAIARAKGKLRRKQSKLSDKQQKELCKMYGSGEYWLNYSRLPPTVYRTLFRGKYWKIGSNEISRERLCTTEMTL